MLGTLAASRVFDPRRIATLGAWWDAMDSASITTVSGAVSAWADKSGNGFTATQGVAASRPSLSTIGGRQGLLFPGPGGNGGTTVNLTHSLGNSTNWTIIAAIRTTTQGTPTFSGVFASGTGNSGVMLLSRSGSSGTNRWGSYTNTSAPSNSVLADSTNYILTAVDNGSSGGSFFMNGISNGSYLADSTGQTSQHIGGQDANQNFAGYVFEVLAFRSALSGAARLAVERYLANKWGIALPPTVSNADAQSWINRVYENNGTVSQSTASAVNDFCNAIDAAGIRDRFYRLNLFCGSNLAAALVPLYRGPSLGGTQFGNTTDTNVSFVSGDYSETAGLTANLNKYLRTGCTVSGMGLGTTLHHHQTYFGPITFNNRLSFGTTNAGACRLYTYALSATQWSMVYSGSTSAEVFPAGSLFRRLILSRTASNLATVYANGASAGSSSISTSPVADTNEIWVFRNSSTGAGGQSLGVGMRSYSFGDSMTAAQAAAFDTALASFFTAIGRPT